MGLSLDKLREQLTHAISHRDQFSFSYQQAIGAITLLQEQIKILMVAEALDQKKAADAEAARLALIAAAEAEAKKQCELADIAIAKLDMDIKLDQGVLPNGDTNGQTAQ